jgi:hypothetical protein
MGHTMVPRGRAALAAAAWLAAAACFCAVTGVRLFGEPSHGRRWAMEQRTGASARRHHQQLRTFKLADVAAGSGGEGEGGGGGETLPYATLKILQKFKTVGAAVYAKKSALSAGSAAGGGGVGAQAHGVASATRSAASRPMPLPKPYDNDEMEMIGAMQKQDGMIVDQKKEAEERAKLGAKAPPLKPVQCGETCLARKGVWCCRM